MSKFEEPGESDPSVMAMEETYVGLDFPVARDFDSNPPVVSLSEMFARGTAHLQQTKSAYEGEERRKQNRCYEEFVL